MDVGDNYIEQIARAIEQAVPSDDLPGGDTRKLFRYYAVLVLVKGTSTAPSDVHDAWSAWILDEDPHHEALVPFDELDSGVQREDEVFAKAIRAVAAEHVVGTAAAVQRSLFPGGEPSPMEMGRVYEQYKLMVQSSESLVSRRQGVNTFFLTLNGALITAIGLVIQTGGDPRLIALSVAVVAVAGAILALAWRSLITSFGQLNTGKFAVINRLEQALPAAIYLAEWEALGRGQDKSRYRSFTSREIWVPNTFFWVFCVVAVISVVVAAVVDR